MVGSPGQLYCGRLGAEHWLLKKKGKKGKFRVIRLPFNPSAEQLSDHKVLFCLQSPKSV